MCSVPVCHGAWWPLLTSDSGRFGDALTNPLPHKFSRFHCEDLHTPVQSYWSLCVCLVLPLARDCQLWLKAYYFAPQTTSRQRINLCIFTTSSLKQDVFIFMCLCVYNHVCWCLWRPERASDPLERWSHWKLLAIWCECWAPNSFPLQKWQVLLTTKPSPQAPTLPALTSVQIVSSLCFSNN